VGRRTPRLRFWAALGPAFVAAIAYVDPGNFATNFSGGASTGYQLIWVVLLANLVAVPIQYLSAKLGIVTGRNLPQLCRELLPRKLSWLMWGQAEIVAMATDLAEFVGAAIGLHLLFDLPLPLAGLTTAVLALLVLQLQGRGYRRFELAIGALLLFIVAGFGYLLLRVPPSPSGSVAGLVPDLHGPDTLLLAVGIVGATVMPHAIYLHSDLTSRRLNQPASTGTTNSRTTNGTSSSETTSGEATSSAHKRQLLRFERFDIAIAMGLAGAVNLSMLMVAARLFHGSSTSSITLEGVHEGLGRMVGGGAALAFAAALLASGISSSSVGTAAGQVVMDGFLGASIPLWLRRVITMTPAVLLLCSGVDPTRALLLSQVVLSFGIPFALLALVILTSRKALMGAQVNARGTVVALGIVVVLLSSMNVLLLIQQFKP
jgi:manganese transport protein